MAETARQRQIRRILENEAEPLPVWVMVDPDGDPRTFTCEAAALIYWEEMHGSDADFKPYQQIPETLKEIESAFAE